MKESKNRTQIDENAQIYLMPFPRVIRMKELTLVVGLARSTIYDRLNAKSERYDPSFPKPVKLGAGAIGWHLAAVHEWINSLR